MPRIIPQSIKNQVITEWLIGLPRDTIASRNGIGTGTVTEIIQLTKRNGGIPDIDLLRAVAVMIKKENLNVNNFADSIRLKNVLDRLELSDEEVDALLEEINIHSFKNGLKNKEFVYKIHELSNIVANLGMSICDIPSYIEEKVNISNNLDKEIIKKQQQIRQLIQDYGRTEADLKEYRLRQPVFDKLTELTAKLEEKETEISRLKDERSGIQR